MIENKRFIMEKSEGQDTIYDNKGLDDYYHLGNDTRDVKALCDLLNALHEDNQRLIRKNKRLHRDWDKLYDLCLDKGCTEDEIIKEMER